MFARKSLLRLKYSPYDSFTKKSGGGIASTTESRQRENRLDAHRLRQEQQVILPKTLKSGRFDEKMTVSQVIAEKEAKREDLMKEKPDSRFQQRISDFRQIQDPDPMSPLFGETNHTQKVRLKEWQKQFERENEKVWLPYERTNFATRMMPNFFVRAMVHLRDGGGLGQRFLVGFLVVVLVMLIGFLRSMYIDKEKAADAAQAR